MTSISTVLTGLENKYELLSEVKGALGGKRVEIGRKFECRYCGENSQLKFKNTAHTFPEALGNKWVFSLDECDKCNNDFSLYESALAEAVGPFLTLGGVKGKNNKTRQTGRTSGSAILQQRLGLDGLRQISAVASGFDSNSIASFPRNGVIRLRIPIAETRFRPQHAYKALSKIAFALLPEHEISNYLKLRAWLLDANDNVDFPTLEVTMSFASIGKTIPLVSGTLLRRIDPNGMCPHIIFIFCAGSVCFQIDLLSDHLEDHIPPVPLAAIKIQYAAIIGENENSAVARFQYIDPVYLNWHSRQPAVQPIKEMILDFDIESTIGKFTPVFR